MKIGITNIGGAPDCCAGGSRVRAPDRTNTKDLTITEENVLPIKL